jgi:xylulokinase
MYLLGIDIGTSGSKTVLFNDKGQALASYTGEYPLYQPIADHILKAISNV